MSSSENESRPGLLVPKQRGEEVRQFLISSHLLDHTFRIGRADELIVFPLKIVDEPDPTLAEYMDLHPSLLFRKAFSFERAKERSPKDYRDLLQNVPPDLSEYLPTSFDVIGTICLVKLHTKLKDSAVDIGQAILDTHQSMTGVFQDLGVSGIFRTREIAHLAGSQDTVTIHQEYGVRLTVDVREAYFSPRLAGERDRITTIISESIGLDGRTSSTADPVSNSRSRSISQPAILDMFCGVGPYAISIAKRIPHSDVHAVDLNPRAIELLERNIEMNAIENIRSDLGDAGEIVRILGKTMTFQHIIMNLPHGAMDFLPDALSAMDEGMIYLYSICNPSELVRRNGELIAIISDTHVCESIDSSELKGYSPTESVYSHDISIGGKLG